MKHIDKSYEQKLKEASENFTHDNLQFLKKHLELLTDEYKKLEPRFQDLNNAVNTMLESWIRDKQIRDSEAEQAAFMARMEKAELAGRI